MKKILGLFCLNIFVLQVSACDVCGCGVGSYYLGILPEFKKRFIGLRYQHKSLKTHISPDGSTSYLTTHETYLSTEIWGALNLGKRFRIMGFVPYNFIERNNQGAISSKNGLGDISMIAYYQLLNKRKTLFNKALIQTLWIGGGLKLPTGKYKVDDKDILSSLNTFQLGTGSTDFMVNAMYDIRLQDAGINTNLSYKINTNNQFQYQFGNKLTANILTYYKLNIQNKFTIALNAGMLFEIASKDYEEKKFIVDNSGGNLSMSNLGIELTSKKISLGLNWQTPIEQNLANKTVSANDRFMVHVSFLL
jgi:hypothetical protein